ncbi:hypothetical protein M1555_00075 [Patescibacteria group bacterium]|nr:hypothetical protein [Patescibacteria group bacterium]
MAISTEDREFLSRLRSTIEGKTEIDFNLLVYLLNAPELTARFQTIVGWSVGNYLYMADYDFDQTYHQEYVFSLGHRNHHGLIISAISHHEMSRDDYNRPVPLEQESAYPGRLLVVMHTHMTGDSRLAPSVLETVPWGTIGDLYAYTAVRNVSDRPIFGITNVNIVQESVRMLFIRPERDMDFTGPSYVSALLENKHRIDEAEKTEDVRLLLHSIGFRTVYFEIPVDTFFGIQPFGESEWKAILGLLDCTESV